MPLNLKRFLVWCLYYVSVDSCPSLVLFRHGEVNSHSESVCCTSIRYEGCSIYERGDTLIRSRVSESRSEGIPASCSPVLQRADLCSCYRCGTEVVRLSGGCAFVGKTPTHRDPSVKYKWSIIYYYEVLIACIWINCKCWGGEMVSYTCMETQRCRL